ncbi:GspE/PulE family protein [Pelobacter propionicus]|uniref:Type II secretion system protein E n=1 Tax=Pelobacter propionicus (strain DSM 2379 / NBRC 103807 / OttBd1) TaxID=338966 RepID=A1ARQ5_PELPD|nr:GspE/PulE family protein [Pelobacter propionicus]ABL00026.1 type II secretion system protein E [Pelobacter propionicus DSM 2379]
MTQSYGRRNIGAILMERGCLTAEQLPVVVGQLESSRQRFGEICIREGFVGEQDLARALAEQFDLEYVDLAGFRMNEELLNSLPTDAIYRFRFVPLAMESGVLSVAVSDPTDVVKLDDLELLLGCPLSISVATESAVASVIKTGEGTRRVLREVSEDFMLQLVRETDRGEEVLTVENISEDISPIIKLINTTLLDALNRRASDIHIETGHEGVEIKYRIDGVLYRASDPIDLHLQAPIISRLKVMSELDISERRIPQDGRFKVRFGSKSIDFRVSIMPSALGEDAVIRILDKESIANDLKGLSLENLGISEREIRRFRKKIREPYGMVLVTGPTGSGKTTTLYAALTEIHTGEEKIITIEDPVEYMLRGVLQIPVNEKKGLTFAKGLRSILRHDPDKIMVGEIRDPETAQIAVQSALTGHLVFTTVHANNVFDVIGRFIHMGIDPYNFVSCLNCVMAQRLVRRVCPSCRRPVTYGDEELLAAGVDPRVVRGVTLYEAHGCEDCNGTGYRGRSAIVELMELNDRIRDLIIGKVPATQLKQAARECGVVFLRDSAVEKLIQGDTTLKEINRVTFVE